MQHLIVKDDILEVRWNCLCEWLNTKEQRQKWITSLIYQNHIGTSWIKITSPSVVFLCQTCHVFLFIFVWFPFSLMPRGETWNKNIFVDFSLCLFAPKNVYLILPSIFIKSPPRDKLCQTVFFFLWSIMSNIPHMRFLPLEERGEKNNFWAIVYCNLETELCEHWVKSSLFPVTLSLMKVAKSPGGLRSTVCLCLREHSRGTGGEARWWNFGKAAWQSAETERGNFGALLRLKFLRQLRPADRFQAPTNRCFICVCLPTLV